MENLYRKVVWDMMETHRCVLRNYEEMDRVGNHLCSEILTEPVEGDPTRMRAFLPGEKIKAALQHQEEFSAWSFKQYREILLPLSDNGKVSVTAIQKMASAYLEAWFKVHQQPIWYGGKPYYCYSKIEIKRLADMATALYLESWLCQDKTNFQTPYNMYNRPYEKLGKKANRGLDETEIARMKRRIKKAKTMERAAKKVSANTRRIPNREPYMKGVHGNLCDLVNATRVLADKDNKLEIIPMLLEKEYVLTTAEDRRVKRYDKTMNVCLRYQELVDEVHALNIEGPGNFLQKKQFVASSMMLHRIEREFRFHYHAQLIRRMMEGSIDMDQFDRGTWQAFFASYKGFEGLITADKRTLPRMKEDFTGVAPHYDPINDAVDVLNINGYIDSVYRVNGGLTEDDREHFVSFDRAALFDLVRILMASFPPKDQHPWEEEEFDQAAKFYRDDFCVVRELVRVRFPSSAKGSADYMLPRDRDVFYEKFVECYQNIEQAENSQLDMLRKAYAGEK